MNQSAFQTYLCRLRPVVARLVDRLEKEFRDGAPWDAIPQTDEDLTFPPAVWRALALNAHKLLGVKRITGAPYATHPTRMAAYALDLLPEAAEAEEVAIFALFHDYLEEGDGRDRAGVERFLADYPGHEAAVLCAIVLSEPMIDYGEFAGETKDLEDVAYVLQILGAKAWPQFRRYATTSLLDKLDNLNHMEYITENQRHAPATRAKKLTKKLSYFHFTLASFGEYAHPAISGLLRDSLAQVARRHGIPDDAVRAGENRLHEIFEENMYTMSLRIAAYHERVWPLPLPRAGETPSPRPA